MANELHLASRDALSATLRSLLAQAEEAERGMQPVLNLVGVPGMGKSFALRQLFEQISPDYPAVTLDFSRPAQSWAACAPALAPLLPPDGPTAWHPDLVPLALTCTTALPPGLDPERPWLLLIDGLDDLAHWPAVQRVLIKPVAEHTRALVVLATRAPISWHYWELHERCHPVMLPQLVLEETRTIARQAAVAPLAFPLHDLALGHPAAVELLLHHFAVPQRPDGPAPRLEQLTEPTRAVVEVIGVLRAVQVPVMQQLLARMRPGWLPPSPSLARPFDGVLRELKAHGCLDYSRDRHMVFTPALRRAVEARLRQADPQGLATIYGELEAIYAEQVEAHPLTNVRAFNEWLYISAAARLHRPSSPDRLNERVSAEGHTSSAPGASSQGGVAWATRLDGLCALIAPGGADVVAQVYSDQELLAHLADAGLLEPVHAALRAHLPLDTAIFTRDEERYNAYAGELLERVLSPASPVERQRMLALLGVARNLGECFTAADLLVASPELARAGQHVLRRDLATLTDRGCCVYHPGIRAFALHPLVRKLLK